MGISGHIQLGGDGHVLYGPNGHVITEPQGSSPVVLPDVRLTQIDSNPNVSGDYYFRGATWYGHPTWVREDNAFVIYSNFGGVASGSWILTRSPAHDFDTYYGDGTDFFYFYNNMAVQASGYRFPGPSSGSAWGGLYKKIVTGTCSPDVTGIYYMMDSTDVGGFPRWRREDGAFYIAQRNADITGWITTSSDVFSGTVPSNNFHSPHNSPPYKSSWNTPSAWASSGTYTGIPLVSEAF